MNFIRFRDWPTIRELAAARLSRLVGQPAATFHSLARDAIDFE